MRSGNLVAAAKSGESSRFLCEVARVRQPIPGFVARDRAAVCHRQVERHRDLFAVLLDHAVHAHGLEPSDLVLLMISAGECERSCPSLPRPFGAGVVGNPEENPPNLVPASVEAVQTCRLQPRIAEHVL